MQQQKLNEIWEKLKNSKLLAADIQPRILIDDETEQSMSVPDANGIETGPWVRHNEGKAWEKMKPVGDPDFQ